MAAKARKILDEVSDREEESSWLLRAAREAVSGDLSLEDRLSRIAAALRQRFEGPSGCPYTILTFDDRVIFRWGDRTYQVGYVWDDNDEVTLQGEPVEVVARFVPARASEAVRDARIRHPKGELLRIDSTVLGPVREAEDRPPSGSEWDVLIIQEGVSKNRNRYTRKVLAEAAPLYEKAKTFLDHKLDPGPFGRSASEVVGFLKDVRPAVVHAENDTRFALAARACVTKKAFREELLEAWRLGYPDLLGLSHDVRAESAAITLEDGPAYDVRAITHVESVDWVVNPSAGGRVMRLVASDVPHPHLQEDARMLQHLIETLKAAGVAVPEPCDEATAHKLLKDALAQRTASPPAGTVTMSADEHQALTRRLEAFERAVQEGAKTTARLLLDRALLECGLPEIFKKRLRQRFEARIEAGQIPTEEEIVAAIKETVEDVAALREANVVLPHVGVPRIELVKDRAEKVRQRLDDFFDPTKPLQSFREVYIDITGDTRITGRMTEDVRRRLSEVGVREGLTTSSFDQILGDSITRRMLKEYADAGLATWRGTIAEVVPLNDFRTQRRLRFGGYGNLPTVNQGAPYQALTSPTDEEVTYAPAKRGGTESITLEMIKNDDVGAIRRIPNRLARAAAQTLHEFVWDFLGTNATIYDGAALAAAGHNNLVTTALSASNIATLRLKIKQQTDMSSGKRLGLSARYLIVPTELEELAFQLTSSDRVMPDTNIATTAQPAAPNFIKKLNLSVIVVEYWTDTNNYWLTASIDQAPMIEVGFLDGQENPELFVQDQPNVGSMFSNDQITYKLRHVYGAAVLDYRPFAAGIVA